VYRFSDYSGNNTANNTGWRRQSKVAKDDKIGGMTKKFTEEEYAARLPKKQVGTAVLFFNTKGDLLIVKPDYKEGWLVPGGSTDENESPLHCAIRETKEEIGLDVPTLQLVGVYYGPKKGVFTDSLKFIFSGGVLSEQQIAEIKLQTEELEKYTFMSPQEAIPLFSSSLQKSIPACLEAIKNNTVAYIESQV
jgi:8-oxo-dGTP pyrophosphatase MutT (NUDIX family)